MSLVVVTSVVVLSSEERVMRVPTDELKAGMTPSPIEAEYDEFETSSRNSLEIPTAGVISLIAELCVYGSGFKWKPSLAIGASESPGKGGIGLLLIDASIASKSLLLSSLCK